jgi:hypothetical protein
MSSESAYAFPMTSAAAGGPAGPDPDPEAVPVAPLRGREPVVPEQSREDTDAGWGEYPEPAGDRIYRDRPPHWDDF